MLPWVPQRAKRYVCSIVISSICLIHTCTTCLQLTGCSGIGPLKAFIQAMGVFFRMWPMAAYSPNWKRRRTRLLAWESSIRAAESRESSWLEMKSTHTSPEAAICGGQCWCCSPRIMSLTSVIRNSTRGCCCCSKDLRWDKLSMEQSVSLSDSWRRLWKGWRRERDSKEQCGGRVLMSPKVLRLREESVVDGLLNEVNLCQVWCS